MAEWSMATVLKTVIPFYGIVSSNLTPSAKTCGSAIASVSLCNPMEGNQTSKATRVRAGFTLIELMLAIGMIGILASVVIVAINPMHQFTAAYDAERLKTMREISQAVYSHLIDQTDVVSGLTETPIEICRRGIVGNPECVSLDPLVPDYLSEIPVDRYETCSFKTGYRIAFRDFRPSVESLYLHTPEQDIPPVGYCDPCETQIETIFDAIDASQSRSCSGDADCITLLPTVECGSEVHDDFLCASPLPPFFCPPSLCASLNPRCVGGHCTAT